MKIFGAQRHHKKISTEKWIPTPGINGIKITPTVEIILRKIMYVP
jgi:hypothetical protein